MFYVGEPLTPPEMETDEPSVVSAFIHLYLSLIIKRVKHSRY